MKQISLFKEQVQREFGGSLLMGKRKTKRPLAFNKTNHLVLKVNNSFLLLKNTGQVETTLFHYARRFGLIIYAFAIHADHIHINFRVGTRIQYNRWIRTVTARLSILIPKLKWRYRPYNRLTNWGKDFRGLKNYLKKNSDEAHEIVEAHTVVNRWWDRYGLSLSQFRSLSEHAKE